MKRKRTITLLVTGSSILLLNLYIISLPAYGIRSWRKRLFLKWLVSDNVPKIAVANAYKKQNEALFLDTRTKEEYNVSHISGARFVDYKAFAIASLKDVPKHQPIITYCSIGRRSGEIGKKLQDAGYTNVQNLYGGIFEWVNNGYPIVDNQNQLTLSVHTFDKRWSQWLERGEKVY